MNILTHSLISGMVAQHLVDRFHYNLAHASVPVFGRSMALIAALHDIGKINKHFQDKIHNTGHGTTLNPSLWGWHAGVGELFLRNFLTQNEQVRQSAYKKQIKKYIPSIVGRHHGTNTPLHRYKIADSMFGGDEWQQPRLQLYEFLTQVFGDEWTHIANESIEWVVSGLVSVSDWIASSMRHQNLHVKSTTQDRALLEQKVQHTLDDIGFHTIDILQNLSFTDIFSFEPNALQIESMKHIHKPGVYIIEAQMGQGKTEVALYAAYQLMKQKKARGIYFGLPTRLTSQKIFQRFQKFIDRIIDKKSSQDPLLIHATSQWDNFGIYELTEIDNEGQEEQRWFLSQKRALIAPFGVGTIDQALLAILNTKFWFIRTFALAGKVVILDEVHSYDAYTGTILDRLIHHLTNIGCTIIILSATLSKSRIDSLVSQVPHAQASDEHATPNAISYPYLHCIQEAGRIQVPIPPPLSHTVTIEHRHISQDEHALDDLRTFAISKAEQGELVLWIENSVAEAQEQYRILSARTQEYAINTGLLHSRFLPKDRRERENTWIGKYGKKEVPERPSQGSILIGTQVLEQSLDIDADLLITRIAPTDMLLQRIGRLWRHESHDALRPEGATQKCIIISPEELAVKKDLQNAFGISGKIYDPYVLVRSFDVWKHITELHLPADIRTLIENTYKDISHEDAQLQKAKQELINYKDNLSRQARSNISQSSSLIPEHRITTRWMEAETIDVLLITRMQTKDENTIVLVGTDGTEITLLKKVPSSQSQQKKKTALMLMENIISVYAYHAPTTIIRSQKKLREYISHYIYTGKDGEVSLIVVCVEASGRLVWEGNENLNDTHSLYYSHDKGFYTEKRSAQ